MLLSEISVEATQLFPLDDCQRRVERIEIGDLDILGVNILVSIPREGNATADVISFGRRAGGDGKCPVETVVDEFEAHAGVGKRNFPLFQLREDHRLGGARVGADDTKPMSRSRSTFEASILNRCGTMLRCMWP